MDRTGLRGTNGEIWLRLKENLEVFFFFVRPPLDASETDFMAFSKAANLNDKLWPRNVRPKEKEYAEKVVM